MKLTSTSIINYSGQIGAQVARAVLSILFIRLCLAMLATVGRRVYKLFGACLIIILLIIILLVGLLLAGRSVHRASAQGLPSEQVTVVMILDNSGSMKSNDPNGLRFTAARLFIALLDDGDQAGVITFATQSRPITPGLVGIQDSAARSRLASLVQPSLPGGWTDIRAAFSDARDMLAKADRSERQGIIVLLTDGQPEPSQPETNYAAQTLDLIDSLDVPVISIALTQAAQTPFLNQIAARSGGSVIPASDATDLLDAYLQILGQVKNRTVIHGVSSSLPAQSGNQAFVEIDPAAAPFIDQASFVISKAAGASAVLYAPDGQLVAQSAALLDDPGFLALTVEKPAAGKWIFRTNGKNEVQARAILHARIQLKAAVPGPIHPTGEPLTIRLRVVESEPSPISVVGQANFSALITRPDRQQERIDQFYDDGSHGDAHAGDGEYTRQYLNADIPGVYAISIQGWKGIIPLQASGTVLAAEFPAPFVDSPLSGSHAAGGDPIPLQIHLRGGQPPVLDHGEVIATIQTASGKPVAETVLKLKDGAYLGTFIPAADDTYQVIFTLRNAAYLGTAYTRSVQTSFDVQTAPTVAVQNQALDLGVMETQAVEQGIPITLALTSTSQQPETLSVWLEGLPEFSLQPAGQFAAPPNALVKRSLSLASRPGIASGDREGYLVVTARPGVKVSSGRISVRLKIRQPSLSLPATPVYFTPLSGCTASWNEVLTLPISNTSTVTELLSVSLQGLDGQMALAPGLITLAPGQEGIHLVLARGQSIRAGTYNAALVVRGRNGLLIQPAGGQTAIVVSVPSLWSRCQKPLAQGGLTALMALAPGILIVRRVRTANHPACVTGLLRHWPVSNPASVQESDLTSLQRSSLLLGKGGECDVLIPDPSIDDVHITLYVEKHPQGQQMRLRPMGTVMLGYRQLSQEITLQHGDTFTLGERKFQYLSDEGNL